MKVIVTKVSSCKQCPFKEERRIWTLDSFDHEYDWLCTKQGRKIVGFVEWEDEEPKEIPDWCPLDNA